MLIFTIKRGKKNDVLILMKDVDVFLKKNVLTKKLFSIDIYIIYIYIYIYNCTINNIQVALILQHPNATC